VPSVLDQQVVIGLDEVRGKLKLLTARLATAVVRRGLRAGAVVIQNEARRKARRRSGALAKAIVAETRGTLKLGGQVREHRAVVTVKKDAFRYVKNKTGKVKLKKQKYAKGAKPYQRGDIYPRNYAHLVEFGTRPHAVGRGSKLGGTQHGLMHPGAKPYPYMRPAFDSKKGEAQRVAIATIAAEIAKEIAKMGKTKRAAG